jgi:hypothetical protein
MLWIEPVDEHGFDEHVEERTASSLAATLGAT